MNAPQTTAELLAYDPLQAAEDLTGKRWDEDEAVGLLGLAIAMGHHNIKQQRRSANGVWLTAIVEPKYLTFAGHA